MIRPDYREIKHSNELYHYGMPRRSGRYPWGSGQRPFQSSEGKADRMTGRLQKKFERADFKTAKLQDKANRKFNKANQQRNSIFKFERDKAEDTFDEGYKLEEKKQRIEYRMSKKYDRYLTKFDKLNAEIDDELKSKGLEYYNRVLNNTDSQYKAALLKRVS